MSVSTSNVRCEKIAQRWQLPDTVQYHAVQSARCAATPSSTTATIVITALLFIVTAPREATAAPTQRLGAIVDGLDDSGSSQLAKSVVVPKPLLTSLSSS